MWKYDDFDERDFRREIYKLAGSPRRRILRVLGDPYEEYEDEEEEVDEDEDEILTEEEDEILTEEDFEENGR